ncbi:MAG: hypothetical protein JSS81_11875 [Acidobacteria bacterium]|nr:hypothetical protein [Acidobacteriota bacterium]
MKGKKENSEKLTTSMKVLLLLIVGYCFWIYYYCNPKPLDYYDYTFRVADNFLHGAIGFRNAPPGWLNEFVPFEGFWYSVFPLGGVVTMLPFALFKYLGLISEMPGSLIAALTAGGICGFLILIARRYTLGLSKLILLVCAMMFGTWMWTNLAMAGAWQLALGFAMLGELGAIYFTVFDRRPLLAGFFFALAFGNRTEVLLTTPLLAYLLLRGEGEGEKRRRGEEEKRRKGEGVSGQVRKQTNPKSEIRNPKSKWSEIRNLLWFCFVPFILGILTLGYNYLRFHSLTDFGYARIPGVLEEPWYAYGIFSLRYIPANFYEMLLKPWNRLADFPYLVPNGFGGAIWLSSPFLFLVFRRGARDKTLKYAAWAAIAALTFLLWTHGNAGGWQFGYRYAMTLLPWLFLILLETGPPEIRWYEWPVYLFSIALNTYATWLFFWTDYIRTY